MIPKKSNWAKVGEILEFLLCNPLGWVCSLILMSVFVAILSLFGTNNNSRPQNTQSPNYLKAATEKLDKGLPLNKQEVQALDDALDLSGKREAREIELRNGEK